MADPDVVATKLRQIEQYHGELREKQQLSKESFVGDVTQRRAVERMFQNVIQACIDLAAHVARADFGYERGGSKAAVRVLVAEGIIDEQTADTLTDAVGSGTSWHTSTVPSDPSRSTRTCRRSW